MSNHNTWGYLCELQDTDGFKFVERGLGDGPPALCARRSPKRVRPRVPVLAGFTSTASLVLPPHSFERTRILTRAGLPRFGPRRASALRQPISVVTGRLCPAGILSNAVQDCSPTILGHNRFSLHTPSPDPRGQTTLRPSR
jgi:hypothetical protein